MAHRVSTLICSTLLCSTLTHVFLHAGCHVALLCFAGDCHAVLNLMHCSTAQQLICRRIVDSDILKVTLPRPMGLVFEEDKAKGQVVVADFVKGSEAEKRNKVGIFSLGLSEQCLLLQ
jgi:hypothetical protein